MLELAQFRVSKGQQTARVVLYRMPECGYQLVVEVPRNEDFYNQSYEDYDVVYLRFLAVMSILLDWAGDAWVGGAND